MHFHTSGGRALGVGSAMSPVQGRIRHTMWNTGAAGINGPTWPVKWSVLRRCSLPGRFRPRDRLLGDLPCPDVAEAERGAGIAVGLQLDRGGVVGLVFRLPDVERLALELEVVQHQ